MATVSPLWTRSDSPFLTSLPRTMTPRSPPQPVVRTTNSTPRMIERSGAGGTCRIAGFTRSAAFDAARGVAVVGLEGAGQVDAVGHGADAAVAHDHQATLWERAAPVGAADRRPLVGPAGAGGVVVPLGLDVADASRTTGAESSAPTAAEE